MEVNSDGYYLIKRVDGTGTKFVWSKSAKDQFGNQVNIKSTTAQITTEEGLGISGEVIWEMYFTFEGSGYTSLNWTYYTGTWPSSLGNS